MRGTPGPEGFVGFLGIRGRAAWEAVNAFWLGDSRAFKEVLSEDWPS